MGSRELQGTTISTAPAVSVRATRPRTELDVRSTRGLGCCALRKETPGC